MTEYLESDASKTDEYWISYKVLPNETLTKVARKFETSSTRLQEINRLRRSAGLQKNQHLLVPVDSKDAVRYSQYHDNSPDKVLIRNGSSQQYRLQRGDSLWKIIASVQSIN